MPLRLGRSRTASAADTANLSPRRTLRQVQRDAERCSGHNPDREEALNEVVQLFRDYDTTVEDVEIMSTRSNYTRRSLEKYTLEGLEEELGKVTPNWHIAEHNRSNLRGPDPLIESQYKYWGEKFKRFDTMVRVWKSDLGITAFGRSQNHKPSSEERARLVNSLKERRDQLLRQLCSKLDQLYSEEATSAASESQAAHDAELSARRLALSAGDSSETLVAPMRSLAKVQFRPISRQVSSLTSISGRY